jgi:hypothetical protein
MHLLAGGSQPSEKHLRGGPCNDKMGGLIQVGQTNGPPLLYEIHYDYYSEQRKNPS